MTNLPATVDTILPRFDWDDNNKRTYLSYRVCGFTRTDSAERAGVKYETITRWCNKDEAFAEIEKKNMQELRQQYAKEFLKLNFTHNMRLALEKDRLILERSIIVETDKRYKALTKEEWGYLKSIRPLYTAKELNSLESMFSDFASQDWDQIVLMAVKNGKTTSSGADQILSLTEKYQEGPVIESGNQGYTSEENFTEEDISG